MDEHLAYKQSIIPEINSSLFCKLKLIKFVSMSTRYGGTRAVLCAKNKEDAVWGLRDQRYSADTIIRWRGKNAHSANSLFLGFCFLSGLLGLVFLSVIHLNNARDFSDADSLLQSNVFWIQHALYSSKFSCFFSLSLE